MKAWKIKINKRGVEPMLSAFARDKVLHKTKDDGDVGYGTRKEKELVYGGLFLSIVRTARVSNGAKFRRCLPRAKVLSSAIDFGANF